MTGYEYQIDVSVWLALDLVLSSEFAKEVVLEPATEEDIEADLTEAEPGRVVTTAKVDQYRLIVQAKLRSGDAWSVAEVKRLLEHGTNRPSAASRLVDPQNRYLLVTSAGVNRVARGLQVRSAGLWPKAADTATSIKAALPAGSAGRVAIVGNQDIERLERDIKALLSEKLRVPNARLEECRRKLRDEARARMAGAGGGRWTRVELEDVIPDKAVTASSWASLFTHMQRPTAMASEVAVDRSSGSNSGDANSPVMPWPTRAATLGMALTTREVPSNWRNVGMRTPATRLTTNWPDNQGRSASKASPRC
ncbi:hypothetical protein OSS46_20660 [Delftia tsuruhatensis]|nr:MULTISPECIES: hypothetical protein [Comamonadaceae]MCX7507815.1 hypothetical protein [Delftia tsuruhatensis]